MIRTRHILTVLTVSVALGGAGGVIGSSHENERGGPPRIITTPKVKTTLSQAISIAENATGGRAFEAELESDDGVLAYEVEVATANAVQEVLISFETGEVIKVGPADEDADQDCEDDDD